MLRGRVRLVLVQGLEVQRVIVSDPTRRQRPSLARRTLPLAWPAGGLTGHCLLYAGGRSTTAHLGTLICVFLFITASDQWSDCRDHTTCRACCRCPLRYCALLSRHEPRHRQPSGAAKNQILGVTNLNQSSMTEANLPRIE